jgi:uncharacterized LabA/DUF88 family protein
MFELPKMARVRVFVDGENMSPRYADAILEKCRMFGELESARVYGAFANIPKWLEHRQYLAIDAGTGKNATDILLSIHATAIGMESAPDIIVIATSDGDFKHLADFLRKMNIRVVGLGERKAPEQFRKSYDQFIVISPNAVADQVLIAADDKALSVLDDALVAVLSGNDMAMSQCVSLLRARQELAATLPKNGVASYLRKESTVAIVTGQGSNLAIRLKQP